MVIFKLLIPMILLIGCSFAMMNVCIPKPSMKDFHLLKLEGRWYEYARFPNIFQYLNKERCDTIDMTSAKDGVKLSISFINETAETWVHFEGNMTTTPDKPGKVLVDLYDFGLKDYLTVVDAKYDEYVIFYYCDIFLYLKLELAWVLTREPVLDKEKEERLINKLWLLDINIDKLIFENQEHCNLYTSYAENNIV